MDIHEIRKTMECAARVLDGAEWWNAADELRDAEKAVEEAVGEYWTQASELAEALEEMLRRSYNEWELRKIARETLAKWKEANK